MAERTTSTAAFAAIVFFGTTTLGLLVLLLRRGQEPVAVEDGLTPIERVDVRVYSGSSASVVHLISSGRTLLPMDPGEDLPASSGSGVVWNERGLVVTNDHLIRDRMSGDVTWANGNRSSVLYVGSDQEADLAVLFALDPAEPWVPARRGSAADLRVGQRVYAIGNPFHLDQSLTVGVISGLGRRVRGYYGESIHEGMIQTDAAVNPGNSGGPLLDTGGRVVGINTSIADASSTNAGVGFAIPIETVEEKVEQILAVGFEPWPEIGLVLAPDSFEEQWGWKPEWGPVGLIPLQVLQGSPAEEAGIVAVGVLAETGTLLVDRIVSVDGVEITRRADASEIFARKSEGDEVVLEVVRGAEKTLRGEEASRTRKVLVWGPR